MNLTYGEKFSIEVEALPAKSLEALIKRGWSHVMGNEAASKAVASAEKWVKENTVEGQPEPVPSDEAKAGWKLDAQNAMFAAIVAGELGTSIRGPQVTPFDKAVSTEARARVSARLKANGLKIPKGEETIKLGDGQFTMEQLIGRCVARELDEPFVINGVTFEPIRKVADRVVKESQKRIDAAAKAKTEGAKDAESVGL